MRSTFLACAAALTFFGSPALSQEEIQPETVGNVTIPAGTEMLFSVDLSLNHVVDGRVYVRRQDHEIARHYSDGQPRHGAYSDPWFRHLRRHVSSCPHYAADRARISLRCIQAPI